MGSWLGVETGMGYPVLISLSCRSTAPLPQRSRVFVQFVIGLCLGGLDTQDILTRSLPLWGLEVNRTPQRKTRTETAKHNVAETFVAERLRARHAYRSPTFAVACAQKFYIHRIQA